MNTLELIKKHRFIAILRHIPTHTIEGVTRALYEGGIRIIEPAQDLAILLSVASALSNTTLGNKTAILGVVGLTGEVRAVPQIEKRVAECVKLGFERIILPKSNLKFLQKYKDKIQLIGVSHVYQAVKIMQEKE